MTNVMNRAMKLADLRHRAGLSQSKLAERMGVSSAQVSRIEAMYPDVMFTTLRKYLDGLNMDIRFVGAETDGVCVDVSSSEVEVDADRILREGRKGDRSRRGIAKG